MTSSISKRTLDQVRQTEAGRKKEFISRIFVITEDTYIAGEYLKHLDGLVDLNSVVKVIPIVHNPEIGGTGAYDLLMHAMAFRCFIQNTNNTEFLNDIKNFSDKICTDQQKWKKFSESCIFDSKGGIDPKSKLIVEFQGLIKKYGITRGKVYYDDEFWICFDNDNQDRRKNLRERLIRFFAEAKELDFSCAVSNLCIETWFILHFSDFKQVHSTYDKVEKTLNKVSSCKYSKKSFATISDKITIDTVNHAVKCSKKKHTSGKHPDKDLQKMPKNPGSTMFELVEKLINYSKA